MYFNHYEQRISSAASSVGSAGDRLASSASAQTARAPWVSHSASDHELSHAVFGGGSQNSDRIANGSSSSSRIANGSSSSANTSLAPVSSVHGEAAAVAPPPAQAQDMRQDTTATANNGGKTEPEAPREGLGAGSVPLSLLEFRRLIAGGLPSPSTRVFVVTGRGLAGPIRITHITQVCFYFLNKETLNLYPFCF
jgi:hypothetical protein